MDRGRSWMAKPSGITLEEKLHNQTQEPILVPYRNGRVAMLNRATGYQWRWKSVSKTFGQSWDTAEPFIYSPDTPMSVTVLPSGRWLAIKNGRLDQMLYYIPDRLIAYMSDDEGETWYGDLLIDDRRDAVSPCVCAPGDGYIYILYSYAPVIGAEREIRFVKTSEMEINGAAPSRNMTATTNSVIVKSIQALKTFEKAIFKTVYPVVAWCKGFVGFCRENDKYYKTWLVLWLMHFNVISIGVSFFAYYLFFAVSWDVPSLYTQLLKP